MRLTLVTRAVGRPDPRKVRGEDRYGHVCQPAVCQHCHPGHGTVRVKTTSALLNLPAILRWC